ncbi:MULTISPECIES: mechanosensitive ion channel family protein [unclassified Oceanobacter]|uniref:mechanosensitive ion channel family protein n=1 Tax=unclassified Oceanobacter TaxID=2620260 RepID=UPI0026E31F49|nr:MULTISPECIES: mechanosensitive ion channel domain-containing protein [unclassified Oceanobacter]MDO6680814.1 mechanosensitive ion channel [Oceanobacter sp. 5_MG-2023]MDP2504583.1 mechanosensitive ion channel [Oceanobacter sp. 3_MG-2023]MDP2546964.1 mechanosensitive ion channel [Oceanobacter sp. 4_MG-2023]MDP2607788.1 mechanosensitive ion channel [Oceanobacter sp. 1_MG-2023]MDP2611028.1 mechanosensitive ion channel [Oceanobacter sp. 2_MG-2023]
MDWLNQFGSSLSTENIWAEYLLPWGTQIVLALLIFFAGRMVANLVLKAITGMMVKARVEPILTDFVSTVLRALLMVLVVVISLSQLGLDTTSLITLLGAAGLAVGLALKDSLSHFAAGVMLIVFRPFKLGDYVEVGGVAGSVNKITIFSTRLKTPDNRVVTVPNANVFGNTMVNYSEEPTRRLDMVVGISYGSDLLLAKKIMTEMLGNDERILKDPAFTVAVSELADSSVNFVVRPWVKAADYWVVKWELTEAIKLRFDAEGIEIPFPQMDVHLNKVD